MSKDIDIAIAFKHLFKEQRKAVGKELHKEQESSDDGVNWVVRTIQHHPLVTMGSISVFSVVLVVAGLSLLSEYPLWGRGLFITALIFYLVGMIAVQVLPRRISATLRWQRIAKRMIAEWEKRDTPYSLLAAGKLHVFHLETTQVYWAGLSAFIASLFALVKDFSDSNTTTLSTLFEFVRNEDSFVLAIIIAFLILSALYFFLCYLPLQSGKQILLCIENEEECEPRT